MRKLFWGVSLVWVLMGSSVYAQLRPDLLPFELPGLDLNFSGAGAAARGMGGAFVGVSGNLSAISFNPAGLASLDRPQTTLVYRFNRPSVRNRQFAAGGGSPDLDDQALENLDQVDFFALAAPGKLFGRPFVGAFAYTVFSDQFFADQLNTTVPVPIPEGNDTITQITDLNVSRQVSGKLAGFNLGGATRFGPLSFGLTFQIYQGGFSDTTDQVVGPLFLRSGNGQDSTHKLPAFDRQRLANKVDYRGSSVILGMQADYKNARLGFSTRLPGFSLGETDLFRLRSNMDIGIFDTVFISGLPQPNMSSGQLFLTDSRLELPLVFSAGLAYRFGRSLLVDFDYIYTNWGAADLKVRRIFLAPFSNPATLELGSGAVGLTSSHQLRLGWELELNPGFGQLFLRGGVRNLPIRTLTSLIPAFFDTTYQDSFIRDAQGNVIDTISTVSLQYLPGTGEDRGAAGKFWQHFGASLGVGVRWNQVALDLAYDYSTYRRASRTLTPLEGVLTTFHRQRQHRLFVGFTGYFTRI